MTQKCDLIPGLTVRQTLHYVAQLTIGPKVSQYVKSARVKQVLADLALSPVANRQVETLTQSEYRRLAIGTYYSIICSVTNYGIKYQSWQH